MAEGRGMSGMNLGPPRARAQRAPRPALQRPLGPFAPRTAGATGRAPAPSRQPLRLRREEAFPPVLLPWGPRFDPEIFPSRGEGDPVPAPRSDAPHLRPRRGAINRR